MCKRLCCSPSFQHFSRSVYCCGKFLLRWCLCYLPWCLSLNAVSLLHENKSKQNSSIFSRLLQFKCTQQLHTIISKNVFSIQFLFFFALRYFHCSFLIWITYFNCTRFSIQFGKTKREGNSNHNNKYQHIPTMLRTIVKSHFWMQSSGFTVLLRAYL